MANLSDAAPAYEAVEPEIKVFSVGHSWSGNTRWQGNSPEVDESWQELYNSESSTSSIKSDCELD